MWREAVRLHERSTREQEGADSGGIDGPGVGGGGGGAEPGSSSDLSNFPAKFASDVLFRWRFQNKSASNALCCPARIAGPPPVPQARPGRRR